MENSGKPIDFKGWETSGAEIKTSFDAAPIVSEFNSRLWQNLSQKGITLTQAGGAVTLQGRFVRIDEGNRLVRYFLGYAANAGQTVLEVEGELVSDGKKLASLYTKTKSAGLHIFGGAAEPLLKNCARAASGTISKQVIKGLQQAEAGAAVPDDPSFGVFSSSQRSPRQWIATCEARMKQGTRGEALVPEIMRDGYPQTYAESLVGEALRTLNNRSWKILGCSALLFLGGILFTAASYSTAASSSSGGQYFVWFGAVICGIIGLIYGLTTFKNNKLAVGQTYDLSQVETPPAAPPPAPVSTVMPAEAPSPAPVTKREEPAAAPPLYTPLAALAAASPASANPAPQPAPAVSTETSVQPTGFTGSPVWKPPASEKRSGLPGWAWVAIAVGLIVCMLTGAITGIGLISYQKSRTATPAPAARVAPRSVTATKAPPSASVPKATKTIAVKPAAQGQKSQPTATTSPTKPAAPQLSGSSLPALPGAIFRENFGQVKAQAHTEDNPQKTPLTCFEVAWLPDNERLAAAALDVHMLDFRTAKEDVVTTGQQWINGIAVSPDGKYLVTYSSATGIMLWDAASYEELGQFSQKGGFSNKVAISPDSKLLAATTETGFALFDIASGNQILDVPHVNGPYAIAFSPDGKTVAGGGAELKLWSVSDGSELRKYEPGTSGVSDVAFSPDGKVLAAAYHDQHIKLWDVASGGEILTLTAHENGVDGIDFSPDGRLLASIGRDKKIRVWDMSSGDEIGELPYTADIPSDVRFSLDGTMIAACGMNSPLIIWGLPNSKVSQPTATWSPPTPTVAPANAPVITKKAQLDLQMGARKLIWASENQVLLGGYGVTAYNPGDNSQAPIGKVQWVTGMALSPDGKTLATAEHGAIKLMSLDGQGEKVLGKGGDNTLLAFSPDGKTLAASVNQAVILYDVASGSDVNTIPVQTWMQYLTFTPDGKFLAIVSGNTVVLWDLATGSEAKTFKERIQMPKVVAFSPDGALMAVGGSDGSTDGKVVLWDLTSGQWLKTLTGHKNTVNDLAFSKDGGWLVTGSADLTIRVWDVTNGNLLNTLTGHTSAVNAVAFSPDQKALVSGGDHEVILWAITSEK